MARCSAARTGFESAEVVKKAVEMVLDDDGFQVPSSRATEAVESAKGLLSWMQEAENRGEFITFSKWLVSSLQSCFKVSKSTKRIRIEKMWEEYHRLRIADSFKAEWDRLYQTSLGRKAVPTLFQYVSHRVLRQLLEREHTREAISNSDDHPRPMTWEEENALRYVAGYVCRKVQAAIQKSSEPRKEEMVLLIVHMAGDEDNEDENEGTETWTNAIDRGGLWHVSDSTYSAFATMEEEIRRHLKVGAITALTETTKKTILDAILANEELLFQWTIVSADVDDNIASVVLKKLGELYLTVRGFAFASSCLEMYKLRHKQQVQKSKGLRRKVATGGLDSQVD